jgi:hypothetical protein
MPSDTLAALQQRLDAEQQRHSPWRALRQAPHASWLAGLALVISATLLALRTQRRKRSAQVAA